jgi:hypothetical protein
MDQTSISQLKFEVVWKKDALEIREQVKNIWKEFTSLDQSQGEERQDQLVYVIKNAEDKVVGISTAFKTYIKQLKHFFYVYRCFIVPGNNFPGIDSKITVLTRDYLESIHDQELPDMAIGLITLISNPELKKRNLAVWPSGFVYIGNSKEGKHIRVYYFKDARITP